MKPSDFHVGQEVFVVSSQPVSGCSATVTRIGSKWLYLTHRRRFNPLTMMVDAGEYSCCEKVYLSIHAWRHEQRLVKAWKDLWGFVYRHPSQVPGGVTIKTIRECSRLLGLQEKESEVPNAK